LKIDFDDVRDEEYSPSHAGSASRIDFLLKSEKVGIEVKHVSEGDTVKKFKSELAEDKEHYSAHPDCEILICFIYDPRMNIRNPTGFEEDISEQTESLDTVVVIAPQ
jgi:hypothetical protein